MGGGRGGGGGSAPVFDSLAHPRIIDSPDIPTIVGDFLAVGTPEGIGAEAAEILLTDFAVSLATKGLLRATQQRED